MRMRTCALAAFTIGLVAPAPASASIVTMTGRVPTICQLADFRAFAPDTLRMTATLDIFCNSSNGATVTASLVSGDAEGYTFTLGTTSLAMLPGESTDLLNLSTAYRGQQSVAITPVGNAASGEAPVVMFEILAE